MSESRKVLHINFADKGGGAERFALSFLDYDQQAQLLVRDKFTNHPRVHRFPQNMFDRFLSLAEKVTYKLGLKKRLKLWLSIGDQWNRTIKKLQKNTLYQQADIIHLHNIHGGFFDLEAIFVIAREKVLLWSLHDMWFITGGEPYTLGNENYSKGIAKTPHNNFYPLSNPLFDKRKRDLYRKKRLYKKVGHRLTMVPVSHWLAGCYKKSFVFDSRIQLYPIQNGVNINIFQDHGARNWTKPRVAFFNSKSPFKGSDIARKGLLHMDTKLFDLVVVGDTWEEHPDHEYVPFIHGQSAVADFLNGIDILLFPSVDENFSLSVLEAMACGVCLIASKVGGIPEQITQETGFLFRSGNDQELADLLQIAVQNLEQTRQKGRFAAQRVQDLFNEEDMYNKYEKLYEMLLHQQANR